MADEKTVPIRGGAKRVKLGKPTLGAAQYRLKKLNEAYRKVSYNDYMTRGLIRMLMDEQKLLIKSIQQGKVVQEVSDGE